MASFLVIRHKVKDFAAWKKAYDLHQPSRQQAGLTERHLLRGADDPNQVIMLFEARDLQKAREFIASPDLRDAMARAGVADKPDLYFLNSAQ